MMATCDGLHDGQSQAAATARRLGTPDKPLEYLLALCFRNAES